MIVLWWILAIVALGVVFIVAQSIYLARVLRWEDAQTVGLGYYGRSLADRARFKRQLARHARLLAPIIKLNSQTTKLDFRKSRIVYRGTSAPAGSCSVESFERAASYAPRPDDIFVVTQMKCGTTWMQNVVYEVLHRGNGTLVATGAAMYAVSPWLEGRKSVGIDAAMTLGTERPSRIIKTHLGASLCPDSAAAKYIYVARHPVSCFASCIDFVVTNVGEMAPAPSAFEAWYCSRDLMWWGTWTDHVRGWWDRAQLSSNVLFLYFEDMKKDLPGTVRRVAEFLGVRPLTSEELANIVRKCGFAYMQEHQDNFEMHPPHLLQTNAELFVSGTADRHKDVPDETRRRIAAWCVAEMADSTFPLKERYPDVCEPGSGERASA